MPKTTAPKTKSGKRRVPRKRSPKTTGLEPNDCLEIDYTLDLVKHKIAKLRELSPLWEMHQEGIDLDTVQWAAH